MYTLPQFLKFITIKWVFQDYLVTYSKRKLENSSMSGHQSTADMANCELDQLQNMMNPSIDMLMADMNPNPDFSTAPDVHDTLENNTQSYDLGGNGNTAR